jgi:hypothetical protein
MTGKVRVVVEIDAPSPEQVRAYLVARGWQRQDYPRPDVLVFTGPADAHGRPLTVLLPASQDADDYSLRLEEMLRGVSLAEGRPALDVVNDVKAGVTNGATPGNGAAPDDVSTRKTRRPRKGRQA